MVGHYFRFAVVSSMALRNVNACRVDLSKVMLSMEGGEKASAYSVRDRIAPWEWSYMDIAASVCSPIVACVAERETYAIIEEVVQHWSATRMRDRKSKNEGKREKRTAKERQRKRRSEEQREWKGDKSWEESDEQLLCGLI